MFVRYFRNIGRSRSVILTDQWRSLQNMIEYAYTNVPFYRNLFDSVGLEPSDIRSPRDLRKIPVTKKSNLRESPEQFIADGLNRGDLKISSTSGSTGEPTESYFDWKSWVILKYIVKLRARAHSGLRFGQRVAIIEGVPPERSAAKSRSLVNRAIRCRFISLYDSFENNVRDLCEFKPAVIYGPPSYFLELARNLDNRFGEFRPSLLFTSSELLDQATRGFLESEFGCPVLDVYGMTEVKEVSWQCKEAGLYHLNADTCFVEFIRDGEPVGPGEDGDVVITSLVNKAMPLLRYETGDRGSFSDEICKCGCQFPLMQPLYGRSGDYFRIPDRDPIPPFLISETLRRAAGTSISQFRVVQHNPLQISAQVVTNDEFDDGVERRIVGAFRQLLGNDVIVVVEQCGSLSEDGPRKWQPVVSSVGP